MFIKTALLCLIVGLKNKSAEAVECYSCGNASRLPECTNSITCPTDSACFSEYAAFQGSRFYTLGCKSTLACPVQSTISSSGVFIVGRSAPGTGNCSECCNTNNCNRQLCQLEDVTCSDKQGYDCASIAENFNVCGDISHSKINCRRFCGFCSTIDGGWSSWSEWSACDVSCGSGTRTKLRTCSDPAPTNGGSDCPGATKLHENCTKDLCPIHGGWSPWSEWGSCSTSCDIGLQRRDRSCSHSFPARFGDHCNGDSRDDRLCYPGACANGGWSSWSSWGTCTKTCDGGVKTRARSCDNPAPSLTGIYCTGDPTQADSCNTLPCQDGNWSTWSSWGTCTKTCGGGIKTRTRSCDNPAPSLNGRDCTGDSMQIDSCNAVSCQVQAVGFSTHTPKQSPVSGQLTFNKVITNVGNGFDVGSGVFTCKTPGYYYFSASLLKEYNYANHAYCLIRKNGVSLAGAYTYPHAPQSGYNAFVTGVYVHLAAWDNVTLAGCSPFSSIHASIYSSFSGFMVTPDVV